jgi:hypothetical protein
MDPACGRALDEPTAALSKRRAEITILKPTIKYETLIES